MVKKYEDFRNKIIDTINESGFNIGIVTYIMRDINREIEVAYQKQINRDLEEERIHKNEVENTQDSVDETTEVVEND